MWQFQAEIDRNYNLATLNVIIFHERALHVELILILNLKLIEKK